MSCPVMTARSPTRTLTGSQAAEAACVAESLPATALPQPQVALLLKGILKGRVKTTARALLPFAPLF